MTLSVSVIATVLNEGTSIVRLLDSLAAQSRPPDQVVIVDGGSSDNTISVLHEYAAEGRVPLRVISRPGTNISQGRNAAIEAASGGIIAVTDAGVRLTLDWLRELTIPFADPNVHVVSGFFTPDPRTTFEVAMGATVLPALSDISPKQFLPSSRSVAFRKTAWQAINGYPEWLDYCEDLVFDFALRDAGFRFSFAPQAVAYFRPRSSLGAFWRQYFQYARGDGKANLWPRRHAIRYLTYLVVAPLVVFMGFAHHPLWWSLLLAGAGAYLWTPYRRLRPMITGLSFRHKVKAVFWVPAIRLCGDVAKMVGYPVGVLWRIRHSELRLSESQNASPTK